MKISNLLFYIVFVVISQTLNGQTQRFLDAYNFNQKQGSGKINKYAEVQGSPYLNDQFIDGMVYLKDTSIVKLPLRYNIYEKSMEYEVKGESYVIGNPQAVDKIVIKESVFMYLPFIEGKGFFEVLISGKSSLVQKMSVKIQEAQPAKPFNDPIPAKFERQKDLFYIVNNSGSFEINNLKDAVEALKDQTAKIEAFIEQEKIKKAKKEYLIKIVQYYNSLY